MATLLFARSRPRLALVILAAASLAGGCARPAAPADSGAPSTSDSPTKAAIGGQQRLSVKIASLVKLREELEGLLPELSEDAKRAASLNAVFKALRQRIGAERTEAVVASVRAGLQAAEATKGPKAARGPLAHKARLERLTATAERLMVPESASPDDDKLVGLLKQRLALEQEATAPSLAAARLAAQALTHAEELERVVAELARIAEAEGIPVQPATAAGSKATDAPDASPAPAAR